MNARGVTLLETLLYLALFGVVIGEAIRLLGHQLSGKLGSKNEECGQCEEK